MTKPSYSELLKHPLWQKKRLEIFSEHDFTCDLCGDNESPLHVHHGHYEKGKMPWEYDNESLHCLCESCHGDVQTRLFWIHKIVGKFYGEPELDRITGYLLAMVVDYFPKFRASVPNHRIAVGMADYCGISPEDVLNARRNGWITGRLLRELLTEQREEKRVV